MRTAGSMSAQGDRCVFAEAVVIEKEVVVVTVVVVVMVVVVVGEWESGRVGE